jgi:hypothetical protein
VKIRDKKEGTGIQPVPFFMEEFPARKIGYGSGFASQLQRV